MVKAAAGPYTEKGSKWYILCQICFKVKNNLTHNMVGQGFPGGSDGKEPACDVRDLGSIPGSEASFKLRSLSQAIFPTWLVDSLRFRNSPKNELICSLVKQNKSGETEKQGSNERSALSGSLACACGSDVFCLRSPWRAC